MQTIQIALPECIRINPREIQLILAARLYEQGTLSIGQAAVASVVRGTHESVKNGLYFRKELA